MVQSPSPPFGVMSQLPNSGTPVQARRPTWYWAIISASEISTALLPLTSPHLLYYDLVMLLPTGVLLLDQVWRRYPYNGLRKLVILAWCSISTYLVLVLLMTRVSMMPLVLTLILLILWVWFLSVTREICSAESASA